TSTGRRWRATPWCPTSCMSPQRRFVIRPGRPASSPTSTTCSRISPSPPAPPPLVAHLPAPADASQPGAIAEAEAGRTFVLEGPPGTGKSQTITNLLGHAVANGKKVLFVAEKRAALDVVARRLDAVGMGMFALDLHDKGSRASMVRAQIRRALGQAGGGE